MCRAIGVSQNVTPTAIAESFDCWSRTEEEEKEEDPFLSVFFFMELVSAARRSEKIPGKERGKGEERRKWRFISTVSSAAPGFWGVWGGKGAGFCLAEVGQRERKKGRKNWDFFGRRSMSNEILLKEMEVAF